MEKTNEIGHELILLARSTGFPYQLIGSHDRVREWIGACHVCWGQRKDEAGRTEQAETRRNVEFMAVGETSTAISDLLQVKNRENLW